MNSILEAIDKLCYDISTDYIYERQSRAETQKMRAEAVFYLVMASLFLPHENDDKENQDD